MLLEIFKKTQFVAEKVVNDTTFLVKFFAVVVSFFYPLKFLVIVLFVFLILDTYSAVFLNYKHKLNRQKCKRADSGKEERLRRFNLFWKSIKTDKLWDTVEKFFSYPILIFGCYVFDVYVVGTDPSEIQGGFSYSFTGFAFVMIAFTDFQSFIRNMSKATGLSLYRAIYKLLKIKISTWQKK